MSRENAGTSLGKMGPRSWEHRFRAVSSSVQVCVEEFNEDGSVACLRNVLLSVVTGGIPTPLRLTMNSDTLTLTADTVLKPPPLLTTRLARPLTPVGNTLFALDTAPVTITEPHTVR